MAQLVEALRYKSEGGGFDFRWCHLHNPSGRTMELRSTQPLKELRQKKVKQSRYRPGVAQRVPGS